MKDTMIFLNGGDYYISTGTSGVRIRGMDPSLLFDGYTFGITNVTTNGFKLDTARGRQIPLKLNSLLTDNTNFTLGIVFYNSDATELNVTLNRVIIASMYKVGNNLKFGGQNPLVKGSVTVISALKNTTVLAWICKTGNAVRFDLSNYKAQYVGQTSSNARNEIIISLKTAYVKRVFYSSNYYSDDSRAHHEILIQEKLKGTAIL